MNIIESYLKHNHCIIKEWFWEDDNLNCVFRGNVECDEIDDFIDSLIMICVHNSKPFQISQNIILSMDIGEYMDAFYGFIQITKTENNKTKVIHTNSSYHDTIRLI